MNTQKLNFNDSKKFLHKRIKRRLMKYKRAIKIIIIIVLMVK